MSTNSQQVNEARPGPRKGSVRRILLEAASVAVVGATLAFVANAVSPRGLKVGTDYFPATVAVASSAGDTRDETVHPMQGDGGGSMNPSLDPKAEKLAARLKAKGLKMVMFEEVLALHEDPRFYQEQVVFVDARNDDHYQAGHISGAYQFDHYRAEKFLPEIIPVCQAAEQVVVYCTGGECEDSEFAAIILQRAGVSPEKLFIFGGGIAEWIQRQQPVEKGDRYSGVLEVVKP